MTVLAEQIPNLARSQRPSLDRSLDTVIDTTLAMNRVVGTVVVVAQSGDIIYQRAAGFAERETKKPIRLDTIFRFASMTKPIVSAAALALVDQAKLHLDDPVAKSPSERLGRSRPARSKYRENLRRLASAPLVLNRELPSSIPSLVTCWAKSSLGFRIHLYLE
jgi:CubicO group peptidase (beta-lactamase class C family)